MTLILNFLLKAVKPIIPVVKSGTDLCPWDNLEKYLLQAKLTLPTSSQGGDDYICSEIFKPSLALSPSAQAPNCLIQDVEKFY